LTTVASSVTAAVSSMWFLSSRAVTTSCCWASATLSLATGEVGSAGSNCLTACRSSASVAARADSPTVVPKLSRSGFSRSSRAGLSPPRVRRISSTMAFCAVSTAALNSLRLRSSASVMDFLAAVVA
jgi:hypothetical protein